MNSLTTKILGFLEREDELGFKYQERPCKICKDMFRPATNSQKTCSEVCGEILQKKFDAEYYYRNHQDLSSMKWQLIDAPPDWQIRGHQLEIDYSTMQLIERQPWAREVYRGCTFQHRVTGKVKKI